MEPVEDIENALNIEIAESDTLRLEDSRRLTGPGLLWDHPGAILEIACSGFAPELIEEIWYKHAHRVLTAIGWADQHVTARGFEGGHNLALSAPIDQLYSAIFAAETAWHFCAAELLQRPSADFDQMIADLKSVMEREAHPTLLQLINVARDNGIEVLSDDDEISIGHGTGSSTWPISDCPTPTDVNWSDYHNIPIALITGTNGKTTTTRLCAAIARAAGKVSGLTSTDFVRVGDEVLDRGDYSGPGGARLLLRDKRLEIAFLEVARGGILRRGLPTRQARVAVVTNVASDHLGQYGVNTVEELARTKFAVHRALAEGGVLVLNADDSLVVAEAKNTASNIWWFSADPRSPLIKGCLADKKPCAWAEAGKIRFFDGQQTVAVVDISDIPITISGAARHNVMNAMAAVCVARAIGLNDDAISTGLCNFRSDPRDNPGRFNEFAVNGARIFVDFAHNPHSIAAVVDTVVDLSAERRFVMLSHAGDRSDQDIKDVTQTALSLSPDFIVAAELEDYLRGRASGEVSTLIAETCKDGGYTTDQIIQVASPSEGAQRIIEMIQPGDVALLLVLSEREKVFDLLQR